MRLALYLWLGLCAFDGGEDDAQRIEDLLRLLDSGATAEVAEALAELGDLAPEAALQGSGIDGFGAHELSWRRARAWLLEQAGDERCIAPAVQLLEDPDALVRSHAVRFLAQPELRSVGAAERALALEAVASGDPDGELRRRALRGLGDLEHPDSTAALGRLVDSLTPPERGAAARALATQSRAREVVVARVRAAFEEPTQTPPDVLVQLLATYGSCLAELPGGGVAIGERVPFIQGPRHPDARLRIESARALERYLLRLRVLGELERADEMLAQLVGEGLDDAELLAQRAILALEEGADPEVALVVARELVARSPALIEDLETRKRHAAGRVLEAVSLLALARPEEAVVALDQADVALVGIVLQRLDLRSKTRAVDHAGALETRALVELYRAIALLAAGGEANDPRVLEHARVSHQHSLEGQLVLLRGLETTQLTGFDQLLLHALGPVNLLFQNPRNKVLPRARAVSLERALCRALATVAPHELPGFAPLTALQPRHTSPLKDPHRKDLLQTIQSESYRVERRNIEARLERIPRDDPNRLAWRRALLILERDRLQSEASDTSLLRWRMPSNAGLIVSGHLRDEGEFRAARMLAEQIKQHLSERDYPTALFQTGWVMEEYKARTDLRIGNAWMDEEQPERAEVVLLEALARLEVLERDFEDNGVAPAGVIMVQRLRADALVSLAVNANVKLAQPDAAVAYFEQAFELREDDFTRILLACYRARVGRAEEARALIAETPVLPANYYNLACTYSLMGELDLALDFLERDFLEIRSSAGALKRQQEWARGDPDLVALREHPRFEALTKVAEPEPGADGEAAQDARDAQDAQDDEGGG